MFEKGTAMWGACIIPVALVSLACHDLPGIALHVLRVITWGSLCGVNEAEQHILCAFAEQTQSRLMRSRIKIQMTQITI